MAQKTYLIGLYLVLNTSSRYIKRWRTNIELAGASAQILACIDAILVAVEECLPLIKPAPPTP